MKKISLRAARVNSNLSQKEVAKQMNVDRTTISKWEKGITSPSAPQFIQLCRLYNTPMDSIFLPL